MAMGGNIEPCAFRMALKVIQAVADWPRPQFRDHYAREANWPSCSVLEHECASTSRAERLTNRRHNSRKGGVHMDSHNSRNPA